MISIELKIINKNNNQPIIFSSAGQSRWKIKYDFALLKDVIDQSDGL
jgi:hypothetical protein